MKCPSDGAVLVKAIRHGIEVEHCPSCRGVWLQRGELDKVIEAATPPVVLPDPAPAPAPEPAPRAHKRATPFGGDQSPSHLPKDEKPGKSRYGGRYSRGEVKDFLEDIFDFD